MPKFDEVADRLKEKQDELIKVKNDFDEKLSKYNMECKKIFGIADGEKSSVLDNAVMIKNVVELMRD